MWTQIKKSLNSSLGTNYFDSLDRIMEIEEYYKLYRILLVMAEINRQYPESPNRTANSIAISTNLSKVISTANTGTPQTRVYIMEPWIEEITNDAGIGNFYIKHWLLSPKLKKIGKNAFKGIYADIMLPPSVTEIGENAFSGVSSYYKVIINNKRGAIAGHPWGHPAGDDGIVYLYE